MRRRALLVFALAAFAAVPGCAWLKGFAKKPNVKLEKVDLLGVDFQRARLRADLLLENRVAVPIRLVKVNWGVRIDGDSLVTGDLDQSLEVPANGTTKVQVPFALKFEDLYRISQKYKEQDEAPYRFEGTVSVDTPVGPVSLPFKADGKVPVLKVPQVDLAKAEVKGVSFTGADLRLKFNVKNPNAIALDVQALDYALTLAGSKVLDGKLPAALAIAGKGSGMFDAEVRLSFQQAAAAVQAIGNNSSAEYSLAGTFSAGTPWGVVSAPYSRTGTIKIQK